MARELSRRRFLGLSAGATGALAVGIFAFPLGTESVRAVAPRISRVSREYERVRVGSLSGLAEGEPVDFKYPLAEHNNFLVKLGVPAAGGVGPSGDVPLLRDGIV